MGVIAYEFMLGRVVSKLNVRDRMLEDHDKRFEMQSYPNKFK